MKNWIRTTLSILAVLTIVPSGFSQEIAPISDQSDAQKTSEELIATEALPSVEEIARQKAFLELQAQQLQLEKKRGEKWLPWVMPFAAFIFVLALLSIIFGFERKKDHNRHETIRRYLEKGLEVPRQLLLDKDNPQTWKPTSDLRKGLIWVSIGLGVSLTIFLISGNPKGASLGLIPLFIGVGYFVAAKMDPKPLDEEN